MPIVFIGYWLLAKKNLFYQNLLLLFSSYFFYACWDYRFLFFLIFSTSLDYYTGIKIYESESQRSRRAWFWLSIVVNLGFLAVFKYYNFFIDSLGLKANLWSLKVILPVGISFYTFHGLSYVIDVYNQKIKPEKSLINYSVFVSFFPLLVAGPIERATHLLPQIIKKREFNYSKAVDGLRQILWGFFKKIVIADSCAKYADEIFLNSTHYFGSTIFLGAFFFAFQVYGDFSGYSDIALGVARLFGIDLLQNFSFPYFSRNIAEFWRRWHISLMSWFRDYLYIPLGGGRDGKWMKARNILIVFFLSGLWHGGRWTYVTWALVNAFYMLPAILLENEKNTQGIVAQGRIMPTVKELISVTTTFLLTILAYVIFRSKDLADAFENFTIIFSKTFFTIPQFVGSNSIGITSFILLSFIVIEWSGREGQYAIERLGFDLPKPLRIIFYYGLLLIITFYAGTKHQFFYFQF